MVACCHMTANDQVALPIGVLLSHGYELVRITLISCHMTVNGPVHPPPPPPRCLAAIWWSGAQWRPSKQHGMEFLSCPLMQARRHMMVNGSVALPSGAPLPYGGERFSCHCRSAPVPAHFHSGRLLAFPNPVSPDRVTSLCV